MGAEKNVKAIKQAARARRTAESWYAREQYQITFQDAARVSLRAWLGGKKQAPPTDEFPRTKLILQFYILYLLTILYLLEAACSLKYAAPGTWELLIHT